MNQPMVNTNTHFILVIASLNQYYIRFSILLLWKHSWYVLLTPPYNTATVLCKYEYSHNFLLADYSILVPVLACFPRSCTNFFSAQANLHNEA